MPSLEELEQELADAEAVQRRLHKLLDETEGWDELDADEEEFVSGDVATKGKAERIATVMAAADPGRHMLPARKPRLLQAYVEAGFREFARDQLGRFASDEGGGGLGGKMANWAKNAFGFNAQPDPEPTSFDAKLALAMRTQPNRVAPHGFPIVKLEGKEYIVKQGKHWDRAGADRETLASQLGRDIGINIAAAQLVNLGGGKTAAAIEWMEGAKSVKDLFDERPESAREALEAIPRGEIEQHALYDFVIGNSDSNEGNTLFKDGKMIAIDKEFGLNSNDTAWRAPPHLRHLDETGMGGAGFKFGRGSLDTMVTKGERVAAKLSELGRKDRAENVTARLQVLKRFSELPDERLTIANLELIGSMGR